MTQAGKKLHRVVQLIVFIVFIATSCKENEGRRSTILVTEDQFRKDTAFINMIVRGVAERSFSSEEQALTNLDSAKNLAHKIGYNEEIATIVFYKGNLKYAQNKYQEALNFYEEAIKLAEEREDTLFKARCIERMASIHLNNDPNLALKLYFQALTVFEQAKYDPGIAKVYNILGVYKTSLGQFDTAEVYLNKAIRINQQKNNKFYLIENKGNLAYLQEQKGNLDESEKIHLELVDELIAMSDSISLQIIYLDLASIRQKKGDVIQSLDYIDKALSIAEPVRDSFLLPALYGNKGDLFMGIKNADSAKYFFNKSVVCARAIGDAENEMQALLKLRTFDSIQGNYKEAYIKSRLISVLNDTIYQRKLRNNTKSSELMYENEKIKTSFEIKTLKERSTNRQRLFYLVLFFISVTAIGLLVFVLVLQRKNFQKNKRIHEKELLIRDLEMNKVQQDKEIDKLKLEKVTEELKVKDRELVSMALSVEQKMEFLDYVRKKIKATSHNGSEKESVRMINHLLANIGMTLSEKGDADIFNKRFSIIHEHFFENLKKKHPTLTKSELRFCAYLKIHLTSSQIANILNVTQEAIRKTRYRLRKKTNLSSIESLEDYISRF